jgi:hypothetical protein
LNPPGGGIALTRAWWGGERPGYGIAAWLFSRSLGAIYLIAFVSLWLQIDGLIGSEGINPIAGLLERAGELLGAERYWIVPTLCWIDAGDAFLHLQCGAGTVLALLVVLGIAPVPSLALLWALYLSLCTACQPFLDFQWDSLLLETGLLAIFAAPLTWRHALAPPGRGSRIALALERWLLFRLMVSSGIVKLASGDPTWRNLTALRYHYETQPIPAWTSWYAHRLPPWFQSASAAIMLVIEIAVPFLIFAPRRLRYVAFFLLSGLQVLILATGNYGFFNLLTLALCLLLLDDAAWPQRWRRKVAERGPARGWPRWVVVPVAIVTVVLTSGLLMQAVGARRYRPAALGAVYRLISPLRSISGYGLFAVMTTERPEIVIEGSDDGTTWLPYEFKYKPGDPERRPRFTTPHMPRLDWQMWFAALGRRENNPWFSRLLVQLMNGSEAVLGLLKDNPFPDHPPRYIRAVVYDYRFSTPEERRAGLVWWWREPLRLYHPVLARPGAPSGSPLPQPSGPAEGDRP